MRKLKPLLVILFFLIAISSFSQGTQWRLLGNNNVTAGVNFLGTTNSQPIDFRTNNIQRMTINGTTGFVGVGTPNPFQKFEVDAGNIDILNNSNAYMLGNTNILWHKGEIRNLFVGVDAGTNTSGTFAYQNTFVGFSAGKINTTGIRNTFVGSNA